MRKRRTNADLPPPSIRVARGHATAIFALTLAALFGCVGVGCNGSTSQPGDPSDTTPTEESFVNPVGSLKVALRKGQSQEAWRAAKYIASQTGLPKVDADSVTPENLSDLPADTLALMAQAAHQTGRGELSAAFLRVACANESYADPKRVQQAMIAMVNVGQFYDGLQFLETALQQQPDQHETRRWLFDFYIGAEDRVAALPHGHRLVRARQFDLELLKAIGHSDRRTLDADPLEQMVERNPDDKRPLLGAARSKFDENDFNGAIEILREITDAYPNHHPAQAILGRAYAATRRYNDLEEWAQRQTPGIEAYPGYWLALGDWARAKGDDAGALRSYVEAARSGDPDRAQVWTRLTTALPSWKDKQIGVDDALVETVNERAKNLGRFQQLKQRFDRTGAISRAIALQVAESLEPLGRLWEAEAWASIAMTLPEDDSVDLKGYRQRLVGKLTPETPWRVPSVLPDFDPLVAELPLPSIESVVSRSQSKSTTPKNQTDSGSLSDETQTTSVVWKIDNQAEQRGLVFHGRTGDNLNTPGIMLYQTLGCGGGAIDFDLDGWSDLYLVAAGGTPPKKDSQPNELFRNVAGQFRPVGDNADIGDRGFGQGVAIGDVNEDGFPDILVLNYGPNRLYVNNGDGTFRDASDQLPSGAADEWSSSAAIADLDDDGLSDVVIVNYCEGLGPVTVSCAMSGNKEKMASCSPMRFPALADRFLKAGEDGGFIEVTEQWEATPESPGRGLGIIVGDLDGQRGNEVFIANDMTANHYWSRTADPDRPLSLGESALLRGLAGDDRGIAQGSMGIAAGDFDHDDDLDLYVTNFDREYNTFHSQSSSGIWQDMTAATKLGADTFKMVAFGTEAIDLDNNGDAEFVVTNGHVDLFSRGLEQAQYDQPMQIFERTASGVYRLIDASPIGPYFAAKHVGRSLWTLDVNRDGKQDFAVTHQTEPVALMVNQTPTTAKWLRLVLRGRAASRDAIGSVIRIQSTAQTQTLFQTSGSGYQCSNDPALHVGLGEIPDRQVTVEVTWPTGETERFKNVPINQEATLVQTAEQVPAP